MQGLGLSGIPQKIFGKQRWRYEIVRLPPRPPKAERRYLSLVAIFYNEAPYLAEWLEYHFLVGVEHIHVYDNGSSDEPGSVLAPYLERGLVSVVPWANYRVDTPPQLNAYAHAIANFGPDWRWMGFIDIDEFLLPVKRESFREALADFDDLPAVAIPWIMFGSSGHQTTPNGLVIENFTERAPFPPPVSHKNIFKWKSVLDPSRVVAVHGAHDFEFRDGSVGGGFDERRVWLRNESRYNNERTVEVFRLNHYVTKSKEEFLRKSMGPSVMLTQRSVFEARRNRFLAMTEDAPIHDDTILRFVPKVKARLGM